MRNRFWSAESSDFFLHLWVQIYIWLFWNNILDGALVITEYWNAATLPILNIKKQNETISRCKVQALWIQALKPSTLLHIEQSQAITDNPCLHKVFSQNGRSSLWEDSLGRPSFAHSFCPSLSAMLRTDITLHRFRTGCTGKQTVMRGRKKKRLKLDFGKYKLHEPKTCSLWWASLYYWEDSMDGSSIHWRISIILHSPPNFLCCTHRMRVSKKTST